jgi:hypothetical protein
MLLIPGRCYPFNFNSYVHFASVSSSTARLPSLTSHYHHAGFEALIASAVRHNFANGAHQLPGVTLRGGTFIVNPVKKFSAVS